VVLARPLLQVMLRFVGAGQYNGPALDARIDLRTLAFTAGATLLAAVLFGPAPSVARNSRESLARTQRYENGGK